MSWKKICCPVDFSRESRTAMEEAADLAWRFGATVTILHVTDAPAAPAEPAMVAARDALVLGAAELDRKLEVWRDAAERIAGTPVEVALRSGDPALEISRLAGEGHHDVIVMGTRGESDRAHQRLGSVAQAVVREAPCTVVVVRPPAPHGGTRDAVAAEVPGRGLGG